MSRLSNKKKELVYDFFYISGNTNGKILKALLVTVILTYDVIIPNVLILKHDAVDNK